MSQVSLGVPTPAYIDVFTACAEKILKGSKYTIIETKDDHGNDLYHLVKKVSKLQYFFLSLVSFFINLNGYTTDDNQQISQSKH